MRARISLFSIPASARRISAAERRGAIPAPLRRDSVAGRAEGGPARWQSASPNPSANTQSLRIAEAFGGKLPPIGSFEIELRALNLLAAPDMPEEVREEATARAEQGEVCRSGISN